MPANNTFNSEKEALTASIAFIEAQMKEPPEGKYDTYQKVDPKLNPIVANPPNPNNNTDRPPTDNYPKDKEAQDIKRELESLTRKLEDMNKGVHNDADATMKKIAKGAVPSSESIKSYLSGKKEFIHQLLRGMKKESRVYIKPGQAPPPGKIIKTSDEGKRYYDTENQPS